MIVAISPHIINLKYSISKKNKNKLHIIKQTKATQRTPPYIVRSRGVNNAHKVKATTNPAVRAAANSTVYAS